ncbi:MAG: phosphoserine phosphatase [Methanosarcinaceae archaeon]|nr:phosphoserine phosphatase [Methanosarcinaceae archaeon]MDF1533654.1 phosphoserine phosphatase [Methanosarcinaceae archaeon]
MTDVSQMTERELKEKVNSIRTQIDQNERSLKSIFRELKLHRTDTTDLKEKRDALNAQVKELVPKARDHKIKRDDANQKIANLKTERSGIQAATQKVVDEISQMKTERDDLNKLSKGSVESLSKAYAEELDKLLNADIPLKHEIDIIERLTQLEERLGAAFSANEVHKKIIESYDSSKGIYDTGDNVSDKIRSLAKESQEHHLGMLELYKTIDELRKEADMYHAQINEKYSLSAPLRAKIDPLKAKIEQLREELNVYLERSKEVQLVKDEKKQDEQHVVAKEKLNKTGRLSLQDLKVLMDKGDIKF